MTWTNLPTNFKNLVWSGLKKFRQFNNPDDTVSFQDVTDYQDTSDTQMSASQLNQMTGALNDIMNGEVFYTEDEVDALLDSMQDQIDLIKKFDIHICTSDEYDPVTFIPTIVNPKANVFYLVPDDSGTNNLFTEWIYLNSNWEKFGSAFVDLSQYYTKTQTDNLLGAKQNTLTFDAVPTENSTNPVTSGGIATALDEKADSDDVYSKDEVDSALAGYLPLHGTADQSGGVVPVVLTNEDLNDLRPGVTTWYYCQNSANIGNRPPSNPGSFGLVVYRLAGLGRYQVLTSAGGLIFSRVFRSGGVGWSAWVEWNVSYELPAASGSVLGGVKVGRNLSIGNGVLSADASGIVCEVSGDPAVFGDGGDDVPVKALSVGIEPVQDLHGYDRPWPAGGGKNLLPLSLEDMKTLNTSGIWSGNVYTSNGIAFSVLTDDRENVIGVSTSGTATDRSDFILCEIKANTLVVNTQYRLSGSRNGSVESWLIWMRSHGTRESELSTTGDGVITATNSDAITNKRVSITIYANYAPDLVFKPMLRLGSIADDSFEPYSNVCPISGWTGAGLSVNGASVPITFPSAAGTVYGGTLDAVNQVLTVTHGCAVIGDLSWTYDAQYSRFQTMIDDSKTESGARKIKFTASCFVSVDDGRGISSVPENAIYAGSNSNYVYIKTSAFTSAEDFVSAFSGEKFVYPLASPVTYQLTPVEVRTLLGQNVVSADCGPVSVRYGADTKLYIDNAISQKSAKSIITPYVTNTMTAPDNLETGKLILVEDDLYKVTANVASGDALTVGTNVSKITLAQYIIEQLQ